MTTTEGLTDAEYEAADRIVEAMRTHATVEGEWSPSRIGRIAKVDTVTARRILSYLVAHQMMDDNGERGAWRKFYLRDRDRD